MDAIKSHPRKEREAHLIAIVGGSCAGKSWLAEKLKAALGASAEHLSLDDFYRDCSHLPAGLRRRVNFDHPRAIDWEQVEKVLRDCLKRVETEAPRYNFETHAREKSTRQLRPKPILIMDGLWLLRRPSIRKFFSLRVFVECAAETRVERRLARDKRERGRDENSVLEQWKTVAPMHERFVAPQVKYADLVLSSPVTEEGVQQVLKRVRQLARNEEVSDDRP
jgi:uridine kinase